MIKDKILLIGGSGFIGSNYLNYFANYYGESRTELIVLSRFKRERAINCKNIRYIEGDYANPDFLNALFKEQCFTKVFHFASTTVPVSSNQQMIVDVQDNLVASINLLDVMKMHSCNFILYLSSGGAVYGEFAHENLNELHPCLPISSYGIIKLTIEQYIKLYHKQNGLNYLILRLSNPYGMFHTSEKQGVINIAVRKALKNETFKVWGNGNQSKDYIYVEDLIEIIFALMDMNVENEIINVGSGISVSLNFIIKKIKEIIPSFKVEYGLYEPSDIREFCLDTSKLNQFIKLELTPFEKALSKTIEWEKMIKTGVY